MVEIFKPKPKEVSLQMGTVSVDVDRRALKLGYSNLMNVSFNLELARRNKIQPVSFKNIADQLSVGQLKKTVFFDTPNNFSPGNHWRLLGVDAEHVTVQHCGIYGNYDNVYVKPAELPLDEPFFTGVTVHEYEVDGLPASLGEVVQAIKESKKPKHKVEQILWSDSEGNLVSRKRNLTEVKAE
jgi:hypothetical protein